MKVNTRQESPTNPISYKQVDYQTSHHPFRQIQLHTTQIEEPMSMQSSNLTQNTAQHKEGEKQKKTVT